jgi:hypothetical protein
MIIAFDLHETLNERPKEFYEMMVALKEKGHKVVVLTSIDYGEPENRRLEMLKEVGIFDGFDEIIKVYQGEKGIPCRDYKIDILIDNDLSMLKKVREQSPNTICLHYLWSKLIL